MGHSYRARLAGFIFLFVRAGRGTGHPYRIPIRPYLPLCPGRVGAGAILDGLACPAVTFSLFGVAWAWAIPIGLASRPYLPLCPGRAVAGAILAWPYLSPCSGRLGRGPSLSGWHPGRIFLFVRGGPGQGPSLTGLLARPYLFRCSGRPGRGPPYRAGTPAVSSSLSRVGRGRGQP